MNRLSKIVAVLALWGVVTTPASLAFADSVCAAGSEASAHGCHAMALQQSCSMHQMKPADSSCCRIVPALPAPRTAYAVMNPISSFTTFDSALPSLTSHTIRATVENLRSLFPHCRGQALLCTFLI